MKDLKYCSGRGIGGKDEKDASCKIGVGYLGSIFL
jgi:hypothetical protein